MPKKLTTEEFIKRAKKVHHNRYNYSLVEYIGNNEKVKIICLKHGEFVQTPHSHLSGNGCPHCAGNIKYTTEEFIEKAKKVHGDRYDYSLVNYIGSNEKVKIICLKHGEFEQISYSHLAGRGCRKCAGKLKSTTEEFIENAKKVHGDRYDYSLVNYVNNQTKVKIICLKHGIFSHEPNSHLSGTGCPRCKTSKGEEKINKWLDENKIKYTYQKKFPKCRNKNPLSFDFYLPDNNLLIEYDGVQHFKPVKHFGGINGFIKRQKHDKIKNEFAKDNNIELLRIPYNEFNNIEYILNNQIFKNTK